MNNKSFNAKGNFSFKNNSFKNTFNSKNTSNTSNCNNFVNKNINCLNANLTNLGLNKNGFKIGHINAQGLSSKFDEIKLLLKSSENNIDILCISETKFNEFAHKTEAFIIDNYQISFRRDRKFNLGGGLIVFVKQGINCIRRNDLEYKDLELMWLEIKPNKCKPFIVGYIYRPPDSKSVWKDRFDSKLEKIQLENKEIIILGDINKDLLNSNIKSEWSNVISTQGFKQIIKEPTRVTSNSKTLIDHIYTNYDENISHVFVPKIGISDHYPIICTRKLHHKEKSNNHNKISFI